MSLNARVALTMFVVGLIIGCTGWPAIGGTFIGIALGLRLQVYVPENHLTNR